MNAPPRIVQFRGLVRWEAGPGTAGFTLIGNIVEPQGGLTPAQLSLAGLQPPQLPPTLGDPTLEPRAEQVWVLRCDAREWTVRGTWQLHRDVAAAFFAAVPPRATPWARRLGWGVLLAVATLRPGRWLLARLGGAA